MPVWFLLVMIAELGFLTGFTWQYSARTN